MKKIIFFLVAALGLTQHANAQMPVNDGASYYLPKTAFKFRVLIEKTVFTPGEYAEYAARYLKQTNTVLDGKTSYRILDLKMTPVGVADLTKHFTSKAGPKYNIQKVYVGDNGVLLSVNAEPVVTKDTPLFQPAPKPARLNPREYMNEEILSAGSKAKMAELCAEEIYNIRSSRNDLTRGTAETMPTDGAQLKIMLASLDKQEAALRQLFEGYTEKDTTEQEITVIADQQTTGQLAFRFSEAFGLTTADDLSGEPYYLAITDMQQTPPDTRTEKEKASQKDDPGLFVNVPGMAHVVLYNANKTVMEKDMFFPQFGRVESLTTDLFNKKLLTIYQLNPVTGTTSGLQVHELGK